MSTANKLLYLGETKSKIKDVANMTGAGIDNNTTFRNYAQALYDGYINVLQDRDTLLDNMPKLTSTGSISEGLGLPIYEDKMSKLSTQDGTPTPENPVEVKTVKGYRNLFDIQTIVKGRLDSGVIGYASNTTNLTLNENSFSFTTNANYRGATSDYIEVKALTEYIYKQKTIMTGLSYMSACYDENKNYLGSATTVSLNDYSKKYTMLANTKYFRLNVQLNASGTTTIEEPQLLEGTETLPYVPYGTNWIYTTITGKNLFNKSRITSGYYYNDSGQYTSNNNVYMTDYINVIPNTNYTYQLQNAGSTKIRINFFDADKNWLSQTYFDFLSSSTFTIPNNAIYTRISFSTTIDKDYIQIEQGSNATTYEAYKGNIVPIPLNDNEIVGIGDYKDEYIVDKNGHCWLNKKTGKIVLNGTESYTTMYWPDNKYSYRTSVSDIKKTTSWDEMSYARSNYYKNYSFNGLLALSVVNYGLTNRPEQSEIIIRNDECSTSSSLQTWLSTHNTEVYYVLAEANLIDLNYNVDLTLYSGTNNITNSEDMDMAIKYIKDTYE